MFWSLSLVRKSVSCLPRLSLAILKAEEFDVLLLDDASLDKDLNQTRQILIECNSTNMTNEIKI